MLFGNGPIQGRVPLVIMWTFFRTLGVYTTGETGLRQDIGNDAEKLQIEVEGYSCWCIWLWAFKRPWPRNQLELRTNAEPQVRPRVGADIDGGFGRML